jgi:hypothetical protein
MNKYATCALGYCVSLLASEHIKCSIETFIPKELDTCHISIATRCRTSGEGMCFKDRNLNDYLEHVMLLMRALIPHLHKIGWKNVKITSELPTDSTYGMVKIYITSGEPRPENSSTTIPTSILMDLDEELRYQKTKKFGGDTEEFDKTNTQNDWVAYISAYAGRASAKVARNEREGCEFRANMIKVAALAVSAISAYDKGYCK